MGGSVQLAVQADPQFDIDLSQCKAEVSTPGLWNLGVGINNREKGFQSITNLLSGGYHSAVKNDCRGLLPAYPSQGIDGGHTLSKTSLDSRLSQEEMDAKCCQLCNADSFFPTFDLENPDIWGGKAFPVTQKQIRGTMTAKEPRLQFLVDEVLQHLDSDFGGAMDDHTHSPVGFFLGGLLTACMDDPNGCEQPGMESPVGLPEMLTWVTV